MSGLMLATPEFARIKSVAREQAMRWEQALRPITALSKGRVAALAALAGRIGEPFETVKRKFYAYEKKGLAGLVDRRLDAKLWATTRNGLPEAFLEFWKNWQLKFQRGTAKQAAHEALIQRWHAWRNGDWNCAIPGYDTPPEPSPATGVPVGWTYRRLLDHQPTAFQQKAVTVGRNAARQFLPKVLSTRVGLEPGQLIMFDDQEYDVNVNWLGVARQRVRPAGFNALDLLSGADVLQGYKPILEGADGKKQTLRQVDFEWFVVNYLTTIGYRPEGTTFIFERGTTKTGADFLERMHQATGHAIQVQSGGLHNAPALPGLFKGHPRGNPKFKAARETLFRVVRERMSALPGAIGKDRLSAPEGHYQMLRENEILLEAMGALPPREQALLRGHLLPWHDFVRIAGHTWRWINQRTDHALEGWAELGHIVPEWRYSLESPFLPFSKFLALPEPQQQLARSLAELEPMLWRTRNLAPWEAWSARKPLKKVSGAAIPVLLGLKAARPCKVTQDLHLEITDQEIEPETMIFRGTLTDGRILERGREYAVYLSPFNTDGMEICDTDGCWLGSALRKQRTCRGDAEGWKHEYAEVQRVEAAELSQLAKLGREIARAETDRRASNLAIIRGPVAPLDRRRERGIEQADPSSAARAETDRALERLASQPAPAPADDDWA